MPYRTPSPCLTPQAGSPQLIASCLRSFLSRSATSSCATVPASISMRSTRTQLVSVLAQRCARTDNRLGLVIVDLKGFRQINDTYGRAAGDELLKQTAICLQHAMPETALISRTAGDEFAVLLEFAGAEDDIERRVQEVLAALQQGLDVNNMSVPVRASVGIAYAPEHGNTVSTLLTGDLVSQFVAQAVRRQPYRERNRCAARTNRI